MPPFRFPRSLALTLVLVAGTAYAAPKDHELRTLPLDKIEGMPPLLQHGDVALIESNTDGKLKQITLLSLIAARPEVVHQVMVDLEKFPEFVRNFSHNKVTHNPDGTIDQDFAIDLTVASMSATHRNHYNPDLSVDVEAIEGNDDGRYRWEFHPVPGGTVAVLYAYNDLWHSGDTVRNALRGSPTLEHGLALSVDLVLLRSVKARAEKLQGTPPPIPPGTVPVKPAGFNFLLERGKVAVIRSGSNGRLQDISLLDHIYAPIGSVEQVLLDPGHWSRFTDMMKASWEIGRSADGIAYETEVNMPLISWDTKFLMRFDGRGAIDIFGTGGDLRNAHFRWDLTALGKKATLAVLRANQDLGKNSLLLRALFDKEPLFEHGIAVALGLVQLVGIRGHAEGWK